MKYCYCPKCGGRLINKMHDKNRPVCSKCGFIFYQNPVVGVAAIVIKDDKILLGRRTNSYRGEWCIPCGYVEWDEDVYEAAKREFLEETGLIIDINRVYNVHSNFHNPEKQTVGIWFVAKAIGGNLKADDDLDKVGYFYFDELPKLAFPTDEKIIHQLYVEGLIK
ncbi:NUDIX hydrolase [Crassaminicella profunda]|uniref:NUDIX hydrolase n=1 Tax=Crassaminicella profunda TaxID=1286698 RepID=UPI001CA72216|nr:NUDIX hydrolase [Crassaminicella profunda]QZY56848.1 NUDIX hydrolase [Crassaminicella profunda]